jgi:class 3 adenylate cyclase
LTCTRCWIRSWRCYASASATYRALKVQFQLDDEALEALRDELIEAQRLAADEAGRVLIWTGDAGSSPAPAPEPSRAPHAYTPPHLAEKILTARAALAGERKQGTVLFADLKGSIELLAEPCPPLLPCTAPWT